MSAVDIGTPRSSSSSGSGSGSSSGPASRKRSRRWPRLAVPPAIALLLVLGSAAVVAVEEPDTGDPAYLSPASDAPIGASRLADRLRQRGVVIERTGKTSDALVAAFTGKATLFVPTPDLVHPAYLRMLKLLPASTTVVLVEPSASTLDTGRQPVRLAGKHLSAHTAEPGCDLPLARAAGAAGIRRTSYDRLYPDQALSYRCYGGGLLGVRQAPAEVAVVGAADPFRNDRLDEHGNAALAIALLSASPRLVWLDLHRREPPPGLASDPAASAAGPAPPSLGPYGSPDPNFRTPGHGSATAPEHGSAPGGPPPTGEPDEANGRNPLLAAFPPWVFSTLALLALSVLLLAFALARRLGTPVAEPLPVTVRAGETVVGRGRLYQRAKARDAALHTLRVAARERLGRLLDPGGRDRGGGEPDRDLLVAAVAEQSGRTPESVERILYGGEPTDDDALVRAAIDLEALQQAVTAPRPPPTEGEDR